MNAILDSLNGKKTYLIALAAAIVGLAQAYGIVIPGWAEYILMALGITTIRHGITAEAAKAADAVAKRP